jgi:hypothetical protein
MSRTLNFTLLDDGNVLVEFKNVATTSAMSMRASDLRSCPYIDLFIGMASKKNFTELAAASAERWRSDAICRDKQSQMVIAKLSSKRKG